MRSYKFLFFGQNGQGELSMGNVVHIKKASKNISEGVVKKDQRLWSVEYQLGNSSHKRSWDNYKRPSQIRAYEYIADVLSVVKDWENAGTAVGWNLEKMRDKWAAYVSDIAYECRKKYYNMPDGSHRRGTVMLLEEQADAMEMWADLIESIDFGCEDEHLEEGAVWAMFARKAINLITQICATQKHWHA
jgi:hypothetical protein